MSKITFCGLLLGPEKEDNWLCQLNHSNISIIKKKYTFEQLEERYKYFRLDSRWPFWFDGEDGLIVCYEINYSVEVKKIEDDKLDILYEEIFNNCKKLIYFINCSFGTVFGLNFGIFYIDGVHESDFSDVVLSPYNPSILEDYSQIEATDDEKVKLLNNIEGNLSKSKELETIIETYNINLSISNMKIAFLNIVTCLEALLVSSNSELTYRISRNVAVLLSNNKEQGKKLFNKMKELYAIRSKLVHEGIWNPEKYYKKFDNEPFEDLKMIFNSVFRKYVELGLSKKELVNKLDESGYGELIIN